ncbi:serine hydrolase domain-containing protein [Streptomyces boncukensis]|uniref:Beta-lactamase family protein n=1 Tax=Streptomyces boncukensis TaxID=2711219 RepID=A0A6G4WX88_9ACTN|nr:serine hydrolase domain-containing protein [Streptomyces boncukensis]NGO69227.1 beta-lactamase family protein [Streptomyces boncukensis]
MRRTHSTPEPAAAPSPGPATRRHVLRGSTALAATALAGGAGLGTAQAASAAQSAQTAPSAPAAPPGVPGVPKAAVRRALTALIRAQRIPGAQAVITDARGRVTEVNAGAGDLATGRPFPHRSRLRVASNTKTFTATVVLQLAAAGRVQLDAPVERYLPGVVRGHGNDGRRISVRQLLQHTSGLPELPDGLDELTPGYFRPEEVVARVLRQPPLFPPGARWSYCNVGYVILGMLIERVTGRGYEREVERRIIDRLGLPHTYWPRWPEQRLRGPHPTAYRRTESGGYREVTFINTSLMGAAGGLVSTAQDLTAFFSALSSAPSSAQPDGKLLPPAQLAQMRTTMPCDIARGAEYGLGLARFPLGADAGGGWYWGHGGSVEGTWTCGGVREGGGAVFIAVNVDAEGQAIVDTVEEIFRILHR